MFRWIYSELTSNAGGLGGSKPTQRGAWGAAPAHIHKVLADAEVRAGDEVIVVA